MPTIRTAARALIVRDGAILVACYRNQDGEWFALPGGGQQHGEELTATLVRECLEETGYLVRAVQLRFVREMIRARYPLPELPAEFHQVEHIFLCEVESEPVEPPPVPDTDQTGCRWVAVEELRAGRFYPRALLDALNDPQIVYLGDTE